jgi:hypothetical protein
MNQVMMSGLVLALCAEAFGQAEDEAGRALARLAEAYAAPVSYEFEYQLAGELFSQKARERVKAVEGVRGISFVSDRGRELFIGQTGTGIVRDWATVVISRRSPLVVAPDPASVTAYDSFTPTYFGTCSHKGADVGVAQNHPPLTLAQQRDGLAKGYVTSDQERAETSYLGLATVAIQYLRFADDLQLEKLSMGRVKLAARSMGASATIDGASGELLEASLGNLVNLQARYECDEFMPERLFPARHPRVIRRFVSNVEPGKGLVERPGDVMYYAHVRLIPTPPDEVFDIRRYAGRISDESTGKEWRPLGGAIAGEALPLKEESVASPPSPEPTIRSDGRLETVRQRSFGPLALGIFGGASVLVGVVLWLRRRMHDE